MNVTDARALLVQIAKTDLENTEVTSNRAPWIAKLWPATSTPYLYNLTDPTYRGRPPYCAAGTSWVLKEFFDRLAAMGELRKTTGMTGAQAEKWRCKSPGAWAWKNWAESKKVTILPDTTENVPPGCFMVFDMSHIAIALQNKNSSVITSEYNTGPIGERDGDGCWSKTRNKKLAKCFIDIFDKFPCIP
jgi:hypothetical protein